MSERGEGGLLRADVAGDALFRPVRAGNAFEETVSRLLQAIRLGIVPPPRVAGSGIDGVAPSAPATAEEIEDVLALRDILEVGAARSAAARSLSAGDRELLWTRLRETAAASVTDYRRLDSRLHLTIGELVGAPSLVPLLAENRMRINGLLDDIPLLQPNIEHSNQQHERIVIAVLTGDAERAASAMQEHLEGSAALLRGFLT